MFLAHKDTNRNVINDIQFEGFCCVCIGTDREPIQKHAHMAPNLVLSKTATYWGQGMLRTDVADGEYNP